MVVRRSRDEAMLSTEQLHTLLVCPACHGRLTWTRSESRCEACSHTYPIVDGIPILLLDPAAADYDEVEHMYRHERRQRKARTWDWHTADQFEITRPHGLPVLQRWFIEERLHRMVVGLQPMLPGTLTLVVCGGAGMDAEFLARAGARVINSDISLSAARRARERSRRYGIPFISIVADVQHLPFRDRAVDLVSVFDGLHHLEDPLVGLGEMMRVAARAVSLSEPARAAITALAIRLRLAEEREADGNLVARITPAEVAAHLHSGGFRILHMERYALRYPYYPNAIMRFLSTRGMFEVAAKSWQLGNALIGRAGNTLAVTAARAGGNDTEQQE